MDERSLRIRESELQCALGDTSAAIDASGGGLWLLIRLEAYVVEQGGLGESLFSNGSGTFRLDPPAQKILRKVVSATPRTLC